MSQYVVSTPGNPTFNGKTCGVVFRAGRAFVSEHTIDPGLGLSVQQIIDKMQKDFGYEVEQVDSAKVDAFNNKVEVLRDVAQTTNNNEVATPTPASKKRIGANARAALEDAAEGG